MNFDFEKVHRRFNPLTQEWVLVSPHRSKRPWQGQQNEPDRSKKPIYDPTCYLCPGNDRNQGAKNPKYESTYIFDNDFPALVSSETNEKTNSKLFRAEEETGYCKVICYDPDHSLTMAKMPKEKTENVIKLWIEEYQKAESQAGINYIQIFENKGELMGCSNPHPHGQLWAQSTIPNQVLTKTKSFDNYFSENQTHLLEDYIKDEISQNIRIIDQNEDFVSLVPFWAIWPFEVMIAPKKRMASIDGLSENEVKSLAEILSLTTIRYDNLFQCSFPYSMGIHQKPLKTKSDTWHFHLLFSPPLLRSASIKKHMVGYEMFGMPQRDITAEQAAKQLKDSATLHYLSK